MLSGCLILLALCSTLIFQKIELSWFKIGIGLGSIVLILLSLFIVSLMSIPGYTRRRFAEGTRLWSELHVTWNATGISFQSSRGSTITLWTDFYRWMADRRSLLLYHNKGAFVTIPLRKLSDVSTAQLMIHVAESGLQERSGWER